MINYRNFYFTIKKKKISQYQLINKYYIPSGTLDRIRNNKSISLSTIESLCKILNCAVEDIVTIS